MLQHKVLCHLPTVPEKRYRRFLHVSTVTGLNGWPTYSSLHQSVAGAMSLANSFKIRRGKASECFALLVSILRSLNFTSLMLTVSIDEGCDTSNSDHSEARFPSRELSY